jgi:hypothetical protein
VFLIALLSAIPAARAQDDARASAQARALFQEGVTCSDAADWACAIDRFGRAYGLRRSPVIGSNYALALMHGGRLVEAVEIFRSVLRDPTASPELQADATHFIAELEPQLGHFTLSITGPLDGVTVLVDGHDETSLVGVSTPCDPGEHRVEARRDGVVIAESSAHVDSGASIAVDLTVPERPPPDVTPAITDTPPPVATILVAPAPPPAAPIYEQWWLWTIVGVAVVGVAVGVGVGVAYGGDGTTLPMGSLGVIDARP